MASPTRNNVKAFMEEHKHFFQDHVTGEANATQLAEFALDEFDVSPDSLLGENFFDWAVDVVEGW